MRQNADPVGATTNGITMAVVTALSLLLLIYVGFGEATRTFTHFQTEKLAAQGRLLQTTIEQFLRPVLVGEALAEIDRAMGVREGGHGGKDGFRPAGENGIGSHVIPS